MDFPGIRGHLNEIVVSNVLKTIMTARHGGVLLTLAFGRNRQVGLSEFNTSLFYIVYFGPDRTT